MGNLLVKDKDIVVPGEKLAEGMDYLPAYCTFRDQDKIIASQLGLVNIENRLIKVIPLSGKYIPKVGDMVIGIVIEVNVNNWILDIESAYNAVLTIREATEYIEKDADLTKYYNFGDVITAKITKALRNKIIDLTTKGPGLRKLVGGKTIKVIPSKVPRIIGKQGSMVSMIKEKTNCQITVGQNGVVWIKGEDPKMELLATEAILIIEKKSHQDGLTDYINKFLEENGI